MTTGRPRRVSWYYGWNIVAICALAAIAANALPINAFSLFLGDWSRQLHASVSTLQLGIAAVGVGSALFGPIAGVLADRIPSRWLIGAGLLGIGLFCLGVSVMTELWQYLLLYAAVLPVSILLTTSVLANALLSRWFVQRLGLAVSIAAIGQSMAGVVMPPIIAGAVERIGWRAIWTIGGGIVLLGVLPLVLAVLREHPRPQDERPEGARAPADAAADAAMAAESERLRWRDVVSRPNFWLLIVTYIPMLALYGGCGQNIGPIAASRGLTPQTAGMLLSLLSLSQMVATLVAGVLADRVGSRLTLTALGLATATGGLFFAFGGGVLPLSLGVLLAGCGGAFWPAIAAAIAREFGAGAVGRVFGLATFFMPLCVLAPFAVAFSRESLGSYTPTLTAFAALGFMGAAACGGLMRERPAPRLARTSSMNTSRSRPRSAGERIRSGTAETYD
jgi:MFS family permease